MARRALLEFEKPLVELEEQIEQIRQLARDSEVDVSQQLLQLETLATRRRKDIIAPCARMGTADASPPRLRSGREGSFIVNENAWPPGRRLGT